MNLDYQVLQAAAQWFAVLQSDSVSEADREAWRAWLAAPEHARAWRRVEQISGRLQPLAGDPFSPATTALLRSGQPTRRQALKTLPILCGGGALALVAGAMPWRSWTADQRTAVGEVRDWRLDDGSRLWLNTDSAVDVAFEGRTRQFSLYRGELLMQAAAEPRPLVLRTAEGSLRTHTAARFSVVQRDGSTQLSVFDGAVEIMPSGTRGWRTVMGGRQIAFDSHHIETEGVVQSARQSWTEGVLVADNLRLDAFVAELARYRQGYLGCDPRVADLRVVGAYPLADTDRVLDVLADTLALRINRRLPWWVSLEPV